MRSYVVIAVLALALPSVAPAEQGPDCGRAYKEMLGTIERKKPRLSTEAEVALQRTALRIYDACVMGHLEHPSELFDKLDRTRS